MKDQTRMLSESQTIKEESIAVDQMAKPFSLPASSQGLADVINIVLSAYLFEALISPTAEKATCMSQTHVAEAIWMCGAESLKVSLAIRSSALAFCAIKPSGCTHV